MGGVRGRAGRRALLRRAVAGAKPVVRVPAGVPANGAPRDCGGRERVCPLVDGVVLKVVSQISINKLGKNGG